MSKVAFVLLNCLVGGADCTEQIFPDKFVVEICQGILVHHNELVGLNSQCFC